MLYLEKKYYRSGERFYYLGNIYKLELLNSTKNSVFIDGSAIFILIKKQANPKKILLNWYKMQALEFIKVRLAYYSNLIGCKFTSFTITSAKKRLGSCDFQGNLRFSFYNILMEKPYIDYVVVHELCHLFHLNHSKAFWQKVESIMPDFKQKRAWIKKNFFKIANSL